MNIFRTLHRSILLLFAIVVLAIVTLVHFSISKIVAEQSLVQQRSSSPALSLIVDQLFKPLHISETLGKSRELIEIMRSDTINEEQVFLTLSRLEREFGMTFFIAHEATRMQYHSDGKKMALSEGKVNWYFKYKDIDKDEVADIGKWEDPHFYIDLKIYNDRGKFLGFFGVGKRLSSFINVFEQYKKLYGYDFLFVDPNGNIMLSSEPSLMASFSEFTNLSALPWFSALPKDTQLSRELNNKLVSIDEKDFLIAQVTLPEFDWTVYLLNPLDKRQTDISNGFIVSVVVLLAVVFALFILIHNLLYYFRKDIKPDLIIRNNSRLPDRLQITGLYNELIEEHGCLSIVLVDIDNFSEINQKYGRNAGDEVLEVVSTYLQQNMPKGSVIGRWCSDEFVLLLPKKGVKDAEKLSNNLRYGIATMSEIPAYKGLTVTASFGVSYTDTHCLLMEVSGYAEDALYQARKKGKNTVCVNVIE